ncbi:MAG: ornithine carbamoyltransferase [Candidatus Omnitrophica bacterium]|nr:ornithine carbamoyltransferase [Candidatus Omnitrophota bacterium]
MKKDLLTIDDFTKSELLKVIELAEQIKRSPDEYIVSLRGKNLGIIFEKPSTRTRVSFEVGIQQLGGFSYYLAPDEIQLGSREEVRDVARTLSRYLDAIVLRTYEHETIEEFAQYSSIPVINGLSDYSHPCQALADFMTMKEKFLDVNAITVAYVGDANNVFNSLMMILSKLGVSLRVATPKTRAVDAALLAQCAKYAAQEGATLIAGLPPQEVVKDADVIYTDVFVSMGEEDERDEKLKEFDGFQINKKLLTHCGKEPFIMHCLPAHRGEEITDEVIESERSIVFDQAENRLHVQKGILYYLLA